MPGTGSSQNMDEGMVEKVEANLDVAFPGGDLDLPQVISFGGSLKAKDLGLYYFRPLPPIRGAKGTATFDATKFTADFSQGAVGKVVAKSGHLDITGLDKSDQDIAVEGEVEGPMKDVLQLLDHPPLGYPSKMSLDPATSGGSRLRPSAGPASGQEPYPRRRAPHLRPCPDPAGEIRRRLHASRSDRRQFRAQDRYPQHAGRRPGEARRHSGLAALGILLRQDRGIPQSHHPSRRYQRHPALHPRLRLSDAASMAPCISTSPIRSLSRDCMRWRSIST